MSEDQDKKQKKLTLNTGKLSLNKKLDPSALRKNYVSKTSNVTVEVKKSKVNMPMSADSGSLSNSEFSKRLDIIRKASKSDETKEKKDDRGEIGTLSDFGVEKSEEPKKDVTENAPAELPTEKEGAAKHHPKKHHAPVENKKEQEEEVVKKDDKQPTKHKQEEPRKLKKTDIYNMLDENAPQRTRSLASIRRAQAKQKRKMMEQVPQEKVYREVIVPEVITVSELASRMTERLADVIRELMKLGIMATAQQAIDADTAELIIGTFGHTIKRVSESDVENILDEPKDAPSDLSPRAPVVTVMGHVDHGKTSLLDALKSTDIVSGEAGGITQHIGAYKVSLKGGKSITFIDTPGHAAFTEMRIRGAKVTDVVILVVAADDGIKAQTIEAINHAKAAEVPIIVAINKIDKPDADVERVKGELLQHDLIPEDLGGDIMVVPVSAANKQNLDKLEEAILLIAEMADLKANYKATASGSVVESKVDKGKGALATILIQRGSLKVGDLVVAGETYGKVRLMTNDKGSSLKEAGPSDPVEIVGLADAPLAGDSFNVVETEKQARDITEYRIRKAKDSRVSLAQKGNSLEDLFARASGDGSVKEVPVIIKGDVQGSIEAIATSLAKIEHDEVSVKVLHTAVGGISESDVQLSNASGAIILGFNVRAGSAAETLADKNKVDIRYYSIIYNLIDDMKLVMSGMLKPIKREEYIGSVEIRQVFNITKVGKIAGSFVTKGIIKRGAGVRLLRDDVVIHEGKLKTLKRFKDDVKEVSENYECGIAFENYDDIKEGDKVEVFEVIEEKRTL